MIFLLLFIAACGKDNSSNGSSSISALTVDSTLTVPASGMVGGSTTLLYNGQSYPINYQACPQQVQQYLSALTSNQIPISPISNTYYGRTYRVKVGGVNIVNAQCPFNPTAQCSVVNLSSISAY